MKKIFFLCLTAGILLLSRTETKAQDYKNAIGGRFGVANGVTFKTFIDNSRALDFILNFRNTRSSSAVRFTGLYEIHNTLNIADLPGFKWYYGGGGSIGSYRYKPTDEKDFAVSVDGVIGLDYKFTDAPINISLDWKPAINIAPYTEFSGEGLGISFRFTF